MPLTEREREVLRAVAREAIERGLTQHHEMMVSAGDYPERLRIPGATFVTLRHGGDLRGCVGTLRACRPLVCDVVRNAYHAAFADPRFAPLAADQLPGLDLHISILSALEPLAAASEDELVARLRPGVDGLVLEDGQRAATFLPAMWPRLADGRTFVRALKDKGGWAVDYWSPAMTVHRYTVEDV